MCLSSNEINKQIVKHLLSNEINNQNIKHIYQVMISIDKMGIYQVMKSVSKMLNVLIK